MKLTNQQIYENANLLNQHFQNCNIKLPVRISFFLQKNIQTIVMTAQEIEMARTQIAQNFGELNEDGTQYIVPSNRLLEAQSELNDLFNLEQDLNIHIFKLKEFDNIELTYQQLSAIMFMIEE